MQENVSWLGEEHIGCDRTANHEVVVEVYVVFAQAWDSPKHGFDAGGTECGQILFIAAKNDAVIHYLQGYAAFHVRVLVICNEEDASHPGHEFVH